jgi:hypothetical protein
MSKKSAAHLDEVKRQRGVGNYDDDAAIAADGGGRGEMSIDSTIASDIGQQATESNNHPERLGNYHDEEVGQKGDDRGDDSTTTTNDDDDDDDNRGEMTRRR